MGRSGGRHDRRGHRGQSSRELRCRPPAYVALGGLLRRGSARAHRHRPPRCLSTTVKGVPARMAELADAGGLNPPTRKSVWVRIPLRAPFSRCIRFPLCCSCDHRSKSCTKRAQRPDNATIHLPRLNHSRRTVGGPFASMLALIRLPGGDAKCFARVLQRNVRLLTAMA